VRALAGLRLGELGLGLAEARAVLLFVLEDFDVDRAAGLRFALRDAARAAGLDVLRERDAGLEALDVDLAFGLDLAFELAVRERAGRREEPGRAGVMRSSSRATGQPGACGGAP
jgi:hypothetical protein